MGDFMGRRHNILYLCLGLLVSTMLFGFFYYILYKNSIQAINLKELAYLYSLNHEQTLSNKLLNGYYFYNNSLLFSALLFIPIFKLINHIVKHRFLFYYQFILINITVILTFINIFYENSFSEFHWIIFIYFCVVIFFKEVEAKIKQVFSYIELNQYEILYNLLIIGLYFFIINRFQDLSDLFTILMFVLSFIVTLFIPIILKLVKNKSFKFYKPLMLLMLVIITLLVTRTSIDYNNYIYRGDSFTFEVKYSSGRIEKYQFVRRPNLLVEVNLVGTHSTERWDLSEFAGVNAIIYRIHKQDNLIFITFIVTEVELISDYRFYILNQENDS